VNCLSKKLKAGTFWSGGGIAGYQPLQGKGVFDSEAIGVIVEIDKNDFSFPSPVSDFFRPLF
jgi:hypothetical protein